MGKLTIDTQQVKRFFGALWPDQQGGFMAVSSKGLGGLSTKFFSHPLKMDLICNAIERWSGQDVWSFVCLIGKRPKKGRGSEADVVALPALWLDLDCREGHHEKKELPLPPRDEALAFLNEIPFKPSCIVDSGGGFQIYWLFKEMWTFSSDEERHKAKDFSDRFHKTIISMAKAKGWHCDNTSDLARILRIPGTYNHKGSPVLVKILELNNYRYQPEDFEEFLIDEPHQKSQEPQGEAPSVGSIDSLPFSVKQLIMNGVVSGKRSEGTGSTLAAMVRANIPEKDIIATFESEAIGEKYREKGSGRVKWLQDEIQRSRDFVKENFNNNLNEKNEQNEFNQIEDRIWNKWPELGKEALSGLAGRFVELAGRNSEADPAAILLTFLMRFGVEVGPGPFLFVGDSKHYVRSIAVIVGNSSKARKGTSGKPVTRVFSLGVIDDKDFNLYVPASSSPGPLSSGEGLIWNVRDPVTIWKVDKKTKEGEAVVIDPGVKDKRLFILDEEFSSCLTASKRDGNTISAIIRCLWDSGDLSPLTKNNRIKATGAHIGIVSHITLAELNKKLEDTETFSGFANRILWTCARRQRLVPFPKPMPPDELNEMRKELRSTISKCREIKEVVLSVDAREKWVGIYTELSRDHSGLVGACINRAESQVLRLSMIYSLLDSSGTIEVNHLDSALAVWKYCEDSARFIFASREANPYAQKIMDLLREGREMSTKQIYDAFSRNITKKQMEEAIMELLSQKKIEVETVKQDGPGRPKTVFKCVSDLVREDGLDFTF